MVVSHIVISLFYRPRLPPWTVFFLSYRFDVPTTAAVGGLWGQEKVKFASEKMEGEIRYAEMKV